MAVLDIFRQFVFVKDCNAMSFHEVVTDLTRMLNLRCRDDAPRRPPRVMLIGPPGSGRSTQAQLCANNFGLVCVSPQKLLKAEAERNPPIKMKIQEAAENGRPIPDEIILRLIDERIR